MPPGIRLLDDPYAKRFVRHPALRIALAHRLAARAFITIVNRHSPDLHAFVTLRVRHLDHVLYDALDLGVDQVVLLGAGFDSTSLRCSDSAIRVFEVDAPSTLQDKVLLSEKLQAHSTRIETIWVPCNFEGHSLREELLARGFDSSRPSLIAWVGVSMFLTRAAIAATLTDLASLCAPGSQLVCDYIDPDVVTGDSRHHGARRVASSVARRGEPYQTGMSSEEVENLFGEHGFDCYEHLRAPEMLRRYAPTAIGRQVGGDWLALTTARRR